MTLFDFMNENPLVSLLLAGLAVYCFIASLVAIAAIVVGGRRKP